MCFMKNIAEKLSDIEAKIHRLINENSRLKQENSDLKAQNNALSTQIKYNDSGSESSGIVPETLVDNEIKNNSQLKMQIDETIILIDKSIEQLINS